MQEVDAVVVDEACILSQQILPVFTYIYMNSYSYAADIACSLIWRVAQVKHISFSQLRLIRWRYSLSDGLVAHKKLVGTRTV